MVLLYMVTWIPLIYPSHVSIYTNTMDPMAIYIYITSDFSKQPEILDNIQYYEIYTLKYDATIAQFV